MKKSRGFNLFSAENSNTANFNPLLNMLMNNNPFNNQNKQSQNNNQNGNNQNNSSHNINNNNSNSPNNNNQNNNYNSKNNQNLNNQNNKNPGNNKNKTENKDDAVLPTIPFSYNRYSKLIEDHNALSKKIDRNNKNKKK